MCIDPIRNDTTQEVFASVQAATDDPNATDNDVIKITGNDFGEDVVFDQNISLILSGGYYCSYFGNPSTSAINSLTIKNGTVIVENIIIRDVSTPIGPFTVTAQGVTGGYVNDQPANCGTSGDYGSNPSASTVAIHSIQYSFSHPVNLSQSYWPGAICVDYPCTLAEINNFMDATWVENNVLFSAGVYDATPLSLVDELSGIGAQLSSDKMSLEIQINNGNDSDPCWRFMTNDMLNPEWIFYSEYNVGFGKDLNAFVVP